MNGFELSNIELQELRAVHRSMLKTQKAKNAYRINVIILLGIGWSYEEVSEALLLNQSTVRNYLNSYREGGIKKLLYDNYSGSSAKLSFEELTELELHIEAKLYQRVEDIIQYVKKAYRKTYKVSGMTDLLHRMGFVYKKPKAVPGKADAEKQEEFIKTYAKIKAKKGKNDPIYFMDGSHPQHNTKTAYGWIKCGIKKEVKTNTGRQRININGAIDINTLKPITDISESINAQSTIRLLKKIEYKHPLAKKIYIIADNAKYYQSVLVKEYLKSSKVTIIHLPPYSPNLNLIERLWLFYQKKILYNKYYETFDELKKATKNFFRCTKKYKDELRSLLTENFEIIGTQV